MLILNDIADSRLVDTLFGGGIAVIRTDTLYGIVARADDPSAVEKVYEVKGRDPHKSCVILLDDPSSSYGHSEELSANIDQLHDQPTSYLIRAEDAPQYLLRENNDLAYRVPVNEDLRVLLKKTGPLVAPSANPESLPPARTAQEAIDYFGDSVNTYVDGGEVSRDTPPSRIVRIHHDGTIERLR